MIIKLEVYFKENFILIANLKHLTCS